MQRRFLHVSLRSNLDRYCADFSPDAGLLYPLAKSAARGVRDSPGPNASEN